ncbi:peptidoglycan editing factor PgeF [Herbivorax sp. ANBcel31]|uniref:peptidoglycan editing factor PgeF n=1 Tax=Herbivorax sp. ANBcel31 TaxID=3069754 RepID=UPI0027B6A151|nr:peptidoglycan editing factor PgeF [Herbivorax sp. ANBcel31]MDQ2087219.1 peptidoglycan editing factor PgeF [Herbivorax sp. ANBcel31]
MDNRFSKNDSIIYKEKNGVELIQFKNLLKHKNITHCFTTRNGGVSKNEYKSLNMAFNKNDNKKYVLENFKRVSEAIDIDIENMVFSNQVHDSKIKIVNEKDRGKGIARESDIIGFDGLITNVKNVALVTFFADCVPVFLYDPVKSVIALVHSGWRGTVREISKVAVKKMRQYFESNYEDIEVVIGPSIAKCCFEVDQKVFEEFEKEISWSTLYSKKVKSKWYINLQAVVKNSLILEGIREENILNSGVCTKCNKDLFFSHRGDKGKTGTLTAMMQIN